MPDWINWTGFIATIAGFFVSLFGLIAIYKQAKEAKDAAKSAEEIARQAISKLQNRNLLIGIATTNSQIQIIMDQISNGNLLAARALFHTCSKTVREVMLRPGDAPLSSSLDVALRKVAAAFDTPTMTDTKREIALRSLREISDMMATEEAQRKWME